MKKFLIVFVLFSVLICIWTMVYNQYHEYKSNKVSSNNENKQEVNKEEHRFKTYIDGEYVEIPIKEDVVNEELYDYLHGFLFEVIDADFGIHVGRSLTARINYQEGTIDLSEAIQTHDKASTEIREAIQNFRVPEF